jgi:hypothetical protein
MKKTLQTLGVVAAMSLAVEANAQTPDYGVYPGGLMLDQFGSGNIWDVDSILDSGTPVIIDMFAVWCGPCWSYHTAGTLEDVYNSIGWGGSQEVMIFGVESDASTAENLMDGGGSSQGDWTTGTVFPMANNDAIADLMNLAYYPTLILICPDRTVTEVGQVSAAAWETAVSNCGVLSTAANDLRVVSNETAGTLTSCGGGGTTVDFEVGIQNYSTVNITGTKTVQVLNGVTPVGTVNVPVNLDPYEAMLVTVADVPVSLGANNFTTAITTADDDLTNNGMATAVTVTDAADMGIGDLILEITMDGYGSEVGLLVATGNPYLDDAATAYTAGNNGTYTGLVDFQAIGTWTDGTTNTQVEWTGLATGCYHLVMFDNYGDGLSFGSSGNLDLVSPNSSISEDIDVNYTNWTTFAFEVTTAGTGGFTGVEEVNAVEFATVYPNPTSDLATVEFNIVEASNVSIQVMNTLGQVVYVNNMGEITGTQKVQINTADFEAGMYLINITVDGNVLTKRVSVVK